MRKFIEKYRRKDTCDPDACTPIRLADGAEWLFPRPLLEIIPCFLDGKAIDRSKMLTCGPELDTLLEAIANEDDPAREILATMTLGALLLQKNYDVVDEELERLFVYRPRDPASQDMLRSIIEVATGGGLTALGTKALQAPKNSGPGCASH